MTKPSSRSADENLPAADPPREAADCLFCTFADAEQRPQAVAVVWESNHMLAFRDNNPQAPVHVLVVPKQHTPSIATFADLALAEPSLASGLIEAIAAVSVTERLSEGFRTVFNTGAAAGQTVDHLHAHVLGGRSLAWPPG